MKLIIFFLGTILISSLLFTNHSFAVDYVDSTGYTPSWAKGNGYHTVLLKCNEFTGDSSSDGNWCMEWIAYVLDQGIENFPESTSEVSSNYITNPNDLVKGELYYGPLTQYLPPDSSYEKSWDPNLGWKPNLNWPGWVIGKPFTLPQGSNTENVGIVDNVAQGIFVPDISGKNWVITATMIFEFKNNFKAKDFFDSTKIEIKNKINSQNSMEDISRRGSVFFDDCVGYMKNFDLTDESSILVCLRDKYLVSVSTNQFGGYVTDNYYDIVLPNELTEDISKKIGENIDVAFQKIDDKKSGAVSITGKESCIALVDEATWDNENCIVKVLNVDSGETLTISRGVAVYNSEGIFRNNGTINVLGALSNWGTFENYGTINISNSGQVSISESNIINKGTIMINNDASLVVMSEGILDNFGTISNNDYLINFGIINNHCDGVISGNPIGNNFGTGDIPIREISCKTIPEKVESVPEKSVTEVKTTTETEIPSKSESVKLTEDDLPRFGNVEREETPVWAIGLAAFIVFVLPIIIVVLIIIKIRRRRGNKKEKPSGHEQSDVSYKLD